MQNPVRPAAGANRADLLARASAELIASTLPGGPPRHRRAEDHLLAATPAALTTLAPEERCRVAAAMIIARTHSGTVQNALELAAAEADRASAEPDAQVATATLCSFWAAVSEAATAGASPRLGVLHARRAHDYATASESDVLRYRALGLITASQALSGEFGLAENASHEAGALEERHGWSRTPAAYPLLAGRVLIASARLETGELIACARRLRETLPEDPGWRALAALAEATALLLQARLSEAVAAVVKVTNGSDQHSVPTILQDFAVGLHATLLVARGEPQRALALLDGRVSSGDHTLCFDLQRASAYLRLGRDRQVLVTTDDCIRLGSRHCLRTLPSILLRRAIASYRLGHLHAADTAFGDAFHLMRSPQVASPLLTLPRDEIEVLMDRLRARRPDRTAAVEETRRRALTLPQTDPPPLLMPPLTKRESLIARQLRSDSTLAEIAASLYVSRNTVKSQTSSLYRKLGATSREDAVRRLERAGFYDSPG